MLGKILQRHIITDRQRWYWTEFPVNTGYLTQNYSPFIRLLSTYHAPCLCVCMFVFGAFCLYRVKFRVNVYVAIKNRCYAHLVMHAFACSRMNTSCAAMFCRSLHVSTGFDTVITLEVRETFPKDERKHFNASWPIISLKRDRQNVWNFRNGLREIPFSERCA